MHSLIWNTRTPKHPVNHSDLRRVTLSFAAKKTHYLLTNRLHRLLQQIVTKVQILNYFQSCAAAKVWYLFCYLCLTAKSLVIKCTSLTPIVLRVPKQELFCNLLHRNIPRSWIWTRTRFNMLSSNYSTQWRIWKTTRSTILWWHYASLAPRWSGLLGNWFPDRNPCIVPFWKDIYNICNYLLKNASKKLRLKQNKIESIVL